MPQASPFLPSLPFNAEPVCDHPELLFSKSERVTWEELFSGAMPMMTWREFAGSWLCAKRVVSRVANRVSRDIFFINVILMTNCSRSLAW